VQIPLQHVAPVGQQAASGLEPHRRQHLPSWQLSNGAQQTEPHALSPGRQRHSPPTQIWSARQQRCPHWDPGGQLQTPRPLVTSQPKPGRQQASGSLPGRPHAPVLGQHPTRVQTRPPSQHGSMPRWLGHADRPGPQHPGEVITPVNREHVVPAEQQWVPQLIGQHTHPGQLQESLLHGRRTRTSQATPAMTG
jgi:hypothetical protein